MFHLVVDSPGAVLGADLAISRGAAYRAWPSGPWRVRGVAGLDLAAVSRLDEVRTRDLTQSRENLGLIEPELGGGLVL